MRVVLMLLMLVLGASGCVQKDAMTQLQSVAKDWSAVVRASQVVPVYPLRQDLEPGYAFLVTSTTHEQAKRLREDGFLPIDNELYRFDFSKEFEGLQESSRRFDTQHDWNQGRDANQKSTQVFTSAPVGFPSYSFAVAGDGGARLALPIKGVPLALAALGAEDATGTVLLEKTKTYGVSTLDAIQAVSAALGVTPEDLKAAENNLTKQKNGSEAQAKAQSEVQRLQRAQKLQKYLRTLHRQHMAPSGSDDSLRTRVFLRVVYRVFTVGKVSVNLTATTTGGVGAGTGSPPNITPLEAPNANAPTGDEQQSEAVVLSSKNLGEVTADSLRISTGAESVKVFLARSASRRTVVFEDEFDTPLVIGYHGLDFPILSGGVLGAPVATALHANDTALNMDTYRPLNVDEYERLKQHIKGLKGAEQREQAYKAALKEFPGLFKGFKLGAKSEPVPQVTEETILKAFFAPSPVQCPDGTEKAPQAPDENLAGTMEEYALFKEEQLTTPDHTQDHFWGYVDALPADSRLQVAQFVYSELSAR